MRKTFMGVRLRALREQRGLSQVALAEKLLLSPSYVNQLENNQRPLTVPVLLKLQSALGVDLQFFSEDEEARLMAQLQDVVANVGSGASVPQAEVQALAQQMPALARRVIQLHKAAHEARERLEVMAAMLDDGNALPTTVPAQPHEEVRDFFYTHQNHFAELDAQAEATHAAMRTASPLAGDLAPRLERHLKRRHGISAQTGSPDDGLRHYDPARRTLRLHPDLEPGQRAFQLATQVAYLEANEMMTELVAGD